MNGLPFFSSAGVTDEGGLDLRHFDFIPQYREASSILKVTFASAERHESGMVVKIQKAQFDSITLDCGETLSPVEVAYETYGELNNDRGNAILIEHAFSGDAHAAGISAEDGKPGWWDNMIGPGKGFDTDRYCVICSNVLGGCRGTTGPGSLSPATGKPYGAGFPFVTIADMARLQKMLVDHLGIKRLLSVAGGSMGGMQVLQWLSTTPIKLRRRSRSPQPCNTPPSKSRLTRWGRQAITADPDWKGGGYYPGPGPQRGLAVARMVGHITYMSDESMREKFGRRRRNTGGAEDELAGCSRWKAIFATTAVNSSAVSTLTRI